MADPFSMFMAAGSAGMAIGGAVLKSVGATRSARASADIRTQKAAMYERQAILEGVASEYDVARHREATERVLSKQRNQYLGMGFTLDGTPTDVAFDSITESEKDVYAIRLSSRLKQDNYRAEAANERLNAMSDIRAGQLNAIAPWIELGGNIFKNMPK